MSCGVGHRCGSDPALLWLWCRLVATAPIRPLAWEPPYAEGAALEKAQRQKKLKIKKKFNERERHYLRKEKRAREEVFAKWRKDRSAGKAGQLHVNQRNYKTLIP